MLGGIVAENKSVWRVSGHAFTMRRTLTSRRGHEQIAAGVERADLAVELGAAHDHDGSLAGLGTDLLRDILDLRGELARGSDDEGKGAARLGNLLAVGDALQRG